MIVVSHLEHTRCRKPSFLLNVYIILTLLFDVVQTRTLWLAVSSTNRATFARLFTASVSVKFPIFCLEAYEKTRWIAADGIEHSPEESSGFYSLATYFWLRRLFLRGYRKTLVLEDLFALDKAMSADVTAPRLLEKLHYQRQKGRKQALLRALLAAFPWQFLHPIGPRAALVGFRYAQSFLLQALLYNLEHPESRSMDNGGYGLIGACALIYAGMVASTAYYGYLNNRAASMSRACLCAAVYDGTTKIEISNANDAASLTLMSTDVAHIETGLLQIHQLWGGLVEVALGSWLLYTKLGVAFVVPIALIAFCTGLLYWAMAFIVARQTLWMEKIQTRVALTAKAISDMKNFKMLGIAGRVASLVQTHRAEEIHAGNQFRKLALASVVLSYMPMSLTPVIAFAATIHTFDVSRLFVSLSFMMLLCSPLLSLFQALPVFLAALASFNRIDAYLAQPPRRDFRNFSPIDTPQRSPAGQNLHLQSENNSATDVQREKIEFATPTQQAFVAINASFGWEKSNMILQNLDFVIPKGKITMVFGPTASGKSTLCHAMLGEIPIATGSLTVRLADSAIGYCAQTAYLSNGTLMENIVGFAPFSQKKYDFVIDATLLSTDVAHLPSSHDTDIGSNGIKLSGGQKQRVSLARALYLESEISLFDDALSGLDMKTEAKVFEKVFGPMGLVRKRGGTAVYFTSSSRHLAFADHVVLIAKDGALVQQGPPEILIDNSKSLFIANDTPTNSGTCEDAEAEVTSTENASENSHQPKSEVDCNILGNEARKTGDFTIYLYYLRSTSILAGVIMLFFAFLTGFCTNFSTVWMSYWAQDSFHQQSSFYLGIYGMLRGTELIGIFGASALLLIAIVTTSGLNLHLQAITTVIQAPLSLFTNTDTGTVTSLFSQDMTIIDGELPIALLNAFLVLFDLLGNCFVIAVVSPYVIVSYPVLVATLYVIQMFYLRTSRQLRLLDLEAKGPL